MQKISRICALFALLLTSFAAKADNIALAAGDNTLKSGAFTATFTPETNGYLIIEVQDSWDLTVSYDENNIDVVQDDDNKIQYLNRYIIGDVVSGKTVTLTEGGLYGGLMSFGCYVDFTPAEGGGEEEIDPFAGATVTTEDNMLFNVTFPNFPEGSYAGYTDDTNITFDGKEAPTGYSWDASNILTFEFTKAVANGEHTIFYPAGSINCDDSVNPITNAKDITLTITTSGAEEGGEGGEAGTGETEDFFTAGGLGTSGIYDGTVAIDGEFATMTTEGRAFLDSYLYVNYNTNGEGELNWANGTKLIFTAKVDGITAIKFAGDNNALPYAEADKGSYSNGTWTGMLNAGETVTLTANDGITVTSIKIDINGGGSSEEGEEETTTPTIEIISPAEGSTIASLAYSASAATPFVTVKTNVQYAAIIVNIINEKDGVVLTRNYEGETIGAYSIPASDAITICITPPGETAYKFITGETYTIKVEAYENPWDVGSATYIPATDEVTFTGDGIEREKLSDVKFLGTTPATRTELNMEATAASFTTNADGTLTFEFDGEVSALTAFVPGGMSGESHYFTTAAVEGSNGTKWNVTIPQGEFTSDEGTFPFEANFNFIAKDAEGLYLDLNPSNSEHSLAVWINVTNDPAPEEPEVETWTFASVSPAEGVVTELGTFSFAYPSDMAGWDEGCGTSTSGITGTLTTPSGSQEVRFSEGFDVKTCDAYLPTMTEPGTYAITFEAGVAPSNKGINNAAMTFTWTIPGAVDPEEIATLTGATVATDNSQKFVITFPNTSMINIINATSATFDGENVTLAYDAAVWNAIDINLSAPVADGEHTIVIPAGSISDATSNANVTDITLTITTTGEGGDTDNKVIVLFEAGVNPCTDAVQDLDIVKDGVTLNMHGMNAYTLVSINSNRGNCICAGKYITFTFTSEKYNIVKIDFEGSAGTVLSSSAANLDAYDWTGSSKTYSFIPDDTNVTISKITVYLEGWDEEAGEEIDVPFTMTDAGWGTLILPFDADVPEGLTAYTCGSISGSVLNLEEAESIEANTPYIMAGATGNYTFTGVASNTESSYTDGVLTGVFQETNVSAGYVLQNGEEGVAFYKIGSTAAAVPAYRCYVTTPSSAAISLRFGGTTGINNAIFDANEEPIYDLSGRRIEGELTKGFYIQGSKKFFVK